MKDFTYEPIHPREESVVGGRPGAPFGLSAAGTLLRGVVQSVGQACGRTCGLGLAHVSCIQIELGTYIFSFPSLSALDLGAPLPCCPYSPG